MYSKVEYRVRPVTRFVVTRFEMGEVSEGGCCSAGSQCLGEFDREETAYSVGYALAKAEHERLGYPPGDERIIYPTQG